MLVPFAELSKRQLKTIFDQFYRTDTAFYILGSTHGYSFSELQVEAKDCLSTYAVLNEKYIAGVLRFENKEEASNSVRIMMDFCAWIEDEELENLFKQEGDTKLYTTIFSYEETLKPLLIFFGFSQEVFLEEHVFFEGAYQDLEIWGLKR